MRCGLLQQEQLFIFAELVKILWHGFRFFVLRPGVAVARVFREGGSDVLYSSSGLSCRRTYTDETRAKAGTSAIAARAETGTVLEVRFQVRLVQVLWEQVVRLLGLKVKFVQLVVCLMKATIVARLEPLHQGQRRGRSLSAFRIAVSGPSFGTHLVGKRRWAVAQTVHTVVLLLERKLPFQRLELHQGGAPR